MTDDREEIVVVFRRITDATREQLCEKVWAALQDDVHTLTVDCGPFYDKRAVK